MSDLIVNRHALPDWYRCKSVVFVYPYKLQGREHLVPFYDKLFKYIPEEVNILLVIRDLRYADEIIQKSLDNEVNSHIDFIEIPSISDIWIRDFAPVTVMEQEVQTGMQFEYSPAYAEPKHLKYFQADHEAGRTLWKHLRGYGVGSMYFKWDMGNLTCNGRGTAIVTNRLIADNQGVNLKHELLTMLHVILGFKNTLFVPIEDGDATGHIDGMVRFIDEKIVVVGGYAEGVVNHNFMDTIARNLQQDLGTDFTIIRLLNGEPEDFEAEGIGSAIGNHMNFLRLNDTILFPYYGDSISKLPLKNFCLELEQNKLNITVIPVDIPELLDLVRLGGVLNCIGWQNFYYEKPIPTG